jgi:serine/threonine protein kinase
VLAAVDGPCVRDALAATAATAAAPASFPWRARLAAAAGAAEGLAHAHAHGVAHGDVSSANLLACPARGGVLCDFGLARPAGGPPAERVGQPAYVGPEAALPLPLPPSATAAAADVHALGVVLCELLTGLAPHAARGAPLHDWPSLVAALDARLFDAAALPGPVLGPALIEGYSSSTWVPPGWLAERDGAGNLLMRRVG